MYVNGDNVTYFDTFEVKMMKNYCNICEKYRKFKNPKVSYIFKKYIGSSCYLQLVWE